MRKGIFNQAVDFISKFFKPDELEIVDIKETIPDNEIETEQEEHEALDLSSFDLSKLNLSKEQKKHLQKRIEELRRKHIINGLIPADDLHWNEVDQRYCAASESDIDRIILTCHENGCDEEIMQAVVKEFTEYRTSELLFKQFFERNIGVYRLQNGKPLYEKIR